MEGKEQIRDISQNFFRTRMKRHSSVRKSISFSQPSLFERDRLRKRSSRLLRITILRIGLSSSRAPDREAAVRSSSFRRQVAV
jgi:hypothetical protein